MPILATGNRQGRTVGQPGFTLLAQKGFTLVEVLTVVLILGLLSGIVVLSLPSEEDEAQKSAFRLAAQVRTAQDMAITSGGLIGLTADADSYQFQTYTQDGWQVLALPGTEGGAGTLAAGTALSLQAEGEAPTGTAGGSRQFMLARRDAEKPAPLPTILFTPTGETSAFTATLEGTMRDWQVVVSRDGVIEVALAP